MPHTNTLTATLALLTLAACREPDPIVGGPCAYEISVTEGSVQSVDADGALFETAEGEVFVSVSDLPTLPEVGATLTLQIERITEGTCTPEIVTVLEP